MGEFKGIFKKGDNDYRTCQGGFGDLNPLIQMIIDRATENGIACSCNMRTCSYCGKENSDDFSVCRECGVELVSESKPSAKEDFVFFRGKIAAILLWIQAILFCLVSVVNFWLGRVVSRGALRDAHFSNPRQFAAICYRGAIEDGFIAVVCLVAWYLMRLKTKQRLLLGGLIVTAALFISLRRWMYWEVNGPNPWPWGEPLLIWPCFLYVIAYAVRSSRRDEMTLKRSN